MKQIAALTLGVGLTAALSLSALAAGTSGPLIAPPPGAQPVSYTHLTLPTIYSV